MDVETKELLVPTSAEPTRGEIARHELAIVLEQHKRWIESDGQEGEKAVLSRADLEGADLTGANLERAVLHKANLREADLLLADLRGASLMQANLQGANLLGAEFYEADLQGATLERATGLLVSKLAGTNLFGASLPEVISEFGGLAFVVRTSKSALRLFAAMLLLSASTVLMIATTTDAQLLKNSASLPLPYIGDAIPTLGFYLFLPVLLFGFSLYFHFYLQRLWDALAQLPAILPDGRTLDRTGPWLPMALARDHFKWLRKNRSALAFLETRVAMLLVYWTVPATLVLFWARYLTRQDLHGTMLHVLVIIAAITSAMFLPDLVRRTLAAECPRPQRSKEASRRGAIALGIGVVLTFLSLGATQGAPHDRVRESRAVDISNWAAKVLWVVGYNPYADLREAEISTKPKNWTGAEEELSRVRGARLDKSNLRYAEAHRAFLVNAHLWKADLEGADLSEADMRGAELRQANLTAVVLDRTLMTRANLQEARLRKANLARADLRGTDLSFASLVDAILVDARLDNANLYKANLQGARLVRPILEKADLRESNLEDTKLTSADLNEADLSSAKLRGAGLRDAQLEHAILIEADLERADLRGANLQGALWRGAELKGANLEGADLRGARGLNPAQICPATQRRGVLLDEALQPQVESQCGAVR
jgi:uncharacterized protein YjbI with pentapeptide repeats